MKPLQHQFKRRTLGMSYQAEIMLDIIATFPNKKVMVVVDLGIKYEVGTLATIHKSIVLLRKLGLVKLKANENDARTKLCTLTQKGKNYYETL